LDGQAKNNMPPIFQYVGIKRGTFGFNVTTQELRENALNEDFGHSRGFLPPFLHI
jgi:hypothetical protein